MKTIKGYVSKYDLTRYGKGLSDPDILEVWKDEKDLRECAVDKIQVKKVKITLIKN